MSSLRWIDSKIVPHKDSNKSTHTPKQVCFTKLIMLIIVLNLVLSVQVSDLLREQLFLQSEITYGVHTPSSRRSSRSSSPVRGDERDGEQRRGMYRASINITPALPPRPKTHTEEEEEKGEKDERGGVNTPEVEGAVGVDNLQQLIRKVTVCQHFNFIVNETTL